MNILKTSNKKRRLLLIAAILFLTLSASLAHALVWGRLIPFSPIVGGFERQDSARARVYYHEGADLSLYKNIDAVVEAVEAAHHLKFQRRVELLVCQTDTEHKRYAHSNARFCSLPIYGRVSISKRAQEDARAGRIHMDVYLTHELSHSILFQNMKSLTGFIGFPDWLLEGLAVYNAQQRGVDGYLTRAEVGEQVRKGHFLSPADFIAKPWRSTTAMRTFSMENKYWFIYSELACFVEDLIQTQGEEKFLQFEAALLNGESEENAFPGIYGQSFASSIDDFRQRLTAASL